MYRRVQRPSVRPGGFVADALSGNIGWLLSSAARLAQRRLSARLVEHGITPPQWTVLAALWAEDGLTLSSIAQTTAFDGPTMTGIVDRLEKGGMVRRQRDSLDRRKVTVFLTDSGRDLQRSLRLLVDATERETLEGLTAVQIETLFVTLRAIIDNLTAQDDRAAAGGA